MKIITRLGAVLLLCACLLPLNGRAQTTVKYVHTDALGSVVAMTDSTGAVIETTREYEPFGLQLTPIIEDGPGYTGHVQDAATGLTYMQQRYYDAGIGRFLSADPVTGLSDPVGYFGRYHYAANNPYKFTDPDGRAWGLASKGIKVIVKGGDAASTVAGAVEDARTLLSSNATLGQRAMAAGSLASEILSPVSARDLKAGVNAVERAADTRSSGKLYHYTDAEGAKGIAESGKINPDASGLVYLTTDKVSSGDASNVLFMGQGGKKGSHVVEVDVRQGAGLSPGTQPNELIHQGAVRDGRQADLKVKENDF